MAQSAVRTEVLSCSSAARPSHRKPPKLAPTHRRAPPAPPGAQKRQSWDSHAAHWQPASASHDGGGYDHNAVIANLLRQLNAYKVRDQKLKFQLKMEQELAMLRATNAALREDLRHENVSELKRENEYLNQKTVSLAIALFNAEKALGVAEAEKRALIEQQGAHMQGVRE
uniref:Uncharacterized protein n=1 Tax=Haptolina brevifila TaxID=156173 RepID=A0A7S2DIT2_9EUKA|mmetsp:Transcript_38135/g.76429  ORF Transcript_38135/g.76429 Transcript_38135/m.76429 type:complete len:170 (+) Transcript_38135:168-677(+)